MNEKEFLKSIMEQMPDEVKEALGLKEEKVKKTYKEVAKITSKELCEFVKNREGSAVIKSLMESFIGLLEKFGEKDRDWWEKIEYKYDLNEEKSFRVNRENMTIEEIVEISEVKSSSGVMN
jgi:hypothetical protein